MTLKLYDLQEEFEGLDDEERLQVLIDFAETLPAESGKYDPIFGNEACRVQECQTPVFDRFALFSAIRRAGTSRGFIIRTDQSDIFPSPFFNNSTAILPLG